MRRNILALGIILLIAGAIVVALGFVESLKAYAEALQVCGSLVIIGGIAVAIYGGVAKPPMRHMM